MTATASDTTGMNFYRADRSLADVLLAKRAVPMAEAVGLLAA